MAADASLFDFSEYPREYPLYSTENKKIIGKFKDETHGTPIGEFVGIRYVLAALQQKQQNRGKESGQENCKKRH